MKSILFVFIISICFISCRKEEPRMLGHPYWGEASALRNGKEWLPKVRGVRSNLDSSLIGININWFQAETNFQREYLGFINVPKSEVFDTIKLKSFVPSSTELSFVSYGTLIDDGDVSGDDYDLLESEDNWLIVTEWNESTTEIKGNFQASFLFKGDEHKTPDAGDTVRFTNGFFHTRIVN